MKGTAMKIEIEKDFPKYFKPAYPRPPKSLCKSE